MQHAQRLTPADRSRAVQRLRTATVGATLAGFAATFGIGWVAAVSNPGSQATAASQPTATPSSGTSSASSSASTDTTTNDSPLQSSGSIGLSTGGSGQATSGGS